MTGEENPARATPAAALVARLREAGLTVGTCESLTGGLVAATITEVPGASSVFRGALVTYASDLKTTLAGVDARRVAADGVVNEFTARAMATGARARLGTSLAASCTGVAGPEPQDGQPVGTVWIAVAGPRDGDCIARELHLSGSRQEIRAETVQQVIELLVQCLATSEEQHGHTTGPTA